MNTHDKEGNLKPLMLSELKQYIEKAIDEHGDMIVWLSIPNASDMCFHIDNFVSPAMHDIEIHKQNLSRKKSYWDNDKFENTFIIKGN